MCFSDRNLSPRWFILSTQSTEYNCVSFPVHFSSSSFGVYFVEFAITAFNRTKWTREKEREGANVVAFTRNEWIVSVAMEAPTTINWWCESKAGQCDEWMERKWCIRQSFWQYKTLSAAGAAATHRGGFHLSGKEIRYKFVRCCCFSIIWFLQTFHHLPFWPIMETTKVNCGQVFHCICGSLSIASASQSDVGWWHTSDAERWIEKGGKNQMKWMGREK